METLEALRTGKLTDRKELHLSCGLEEFPREILDLSETLEVLDLSGNRLDALPDDFHRLRKLRIVFFSDNLFEIVPRVLAQCPDLEMVGFKSCRIKSIDAHALPAKLRWLILTDNRLEMLPESIGNHPRLQKLMLAGNRLRSLPPQLRDCTNLELVRISANRLDTFPVWLTDLPRLAWLGWSGNPFCLGSRTLPETLREIAFRNLSMGSVLGQGASGVISRAEWSRADGIHQVAVKIFKGSLTSDGHPQDEMIACIASGSHPNLVTLEGRIIDHPDRLEGLVLGLIPPHYRNLGKPPSYASCTRDVMDGQPSLSGLAIATIAHGVASLAAHLHQRGVNHGDLYAHNILVDDAAHPLMGDFGAASGLEGFGQSLRHRLQRLEVRAYGCLLDDLLGLLDHASAGTLASAIGGLRDACLSETIGDRPLFNEIAETLGQELSSPR